MAQPNLPPPRYDPELLNFYQQGSPPLPNYGNNVYAQCRAGRRGTYIVYLLRARPRGRQRHHTAWRSFLRESFYVGLGKRRGRPIAHVKETLDGMRRPKHRRIRLAMNDPNMEFEIFILADRKSKRAAENIESAIIKAYGGPRRELTNRNNGNGNQRQTLQFVELGVRALAQGYWRYRAGNRNDIINYLS